MRPDALQEAMQALLDALREQAASYRTLLTLGDRQQEALERRDLEEFHRLLHEKAKAMARITALEQASAPHRAHWESSRDQLAEDVRAAVRTVVEELRGLLHDLLEKERGCEETLERTKALMQEELRHLGQGRQAVRSYGARPSEPRRGGLDLGG